MRDILSRKGGGGEGHDRMLRRVGPFLVRGVPTTGQNQTLAAAGDAALDGVDLREGAVGVGVPLDDEGRAVDGRKEALQVSGAQARVEPGAVPAPEGAVDVVAVQARKAFAEAPGHVGPPGLLDA